MTGRSEIILWTVAAMCLSLILWKGRWRLNTAPIQPFAISPPLALALFAVIIVLGQLGLQAARWQFQIPAPSGSGGVTMQQMAQATLGFYAGELIGLAAFILMLNSAPSTGIDQRLSTAKSALLGIVTLLIAYPLVATVGSVAGLIESMIRHRPVDLIAHDTLRQFIESPVDGWYLTMAGLVIVGAAVVEEVLYRGLIQATLVNLRFGRWPAIVITSTIFALMHWSVAQINAVVALFALSLVFGWAYERTGRLITTIIMHAVFNAANLLMATLGHTT